MNAIMKNWREKCNHTEISSRICRQINRNSGRCHKQKYGYLGTGMGQSNDEITEIKAEIDMIRSH